MCCFFSRSKLPRLSEKVAYDEEDNGMYNEYNDYSDKQMHYAAQYSESGSGSGSEFDEGRGVSIDHVDNSSMADSLEKALVSD